MLYLLDTNVIGDLVRGVPEVERRALAVGPADRVVTSTIVVGETLFGLYRLPFGRRRSELERKTADVLAPLYFEPVPAGAAEAYGRTRADLVARGRVVGENDLWIVASALVLGATLVSRDGDVQGIPGLTVQDWSI